jgi:hypothetical protein
VDQTTLANGNISIYPDRKLFKAASPAARAAFVKNALGWVKAYTESPDFKTDYDKRREAAKPATPQSKGTADEQFTKYLAEQRQNLDVTKKNVAKMSLEQQKQMEGSIRQMEASVERIAKDPQMAAIMKQSYEQQMAFNQKTYQERLVAYEKQFPPDPRVLIATRLRQFLDLSKDIAFDAKLVPNGAGKMQFADQQYQNKPGYWKLCYRAGKEPVAAARAFATEWLHQIEGK